MKQIISTETLLLTIFLRPWLGEIIKTEIKKDYQLISPETPLIKIIFRPWRRTPDGLCEENVVEAPQIG